METIKIRAGLRLATRADVFNDNGPISNKMLFLKCPDTHKFMGVYIIPQIYNLERQVMSEADKKSWLALNKYTLDELNGGLNYKQFYVLTESYNAQDFNFIIRLRAADDFDFFDAPHSVKQNLIYFTKISENEIKGPHIMKYTTQSDHIKKALEAGTLLVPSKTQTFQPYKMAVAS